MAEELGKAFVMDELWEMNIHVNPVDRETQLTISQNVSMLQNNRHPFISYIHAVENKRKTTICDKLFKERLKEFKDPDHPKDGVKMEDILKEFEALHDNEHRLDLNQMAKNSIAIDMDPKRLFCIFSQYATT